MANEQAASRPRPRHFPARYKLGILDEYDRLDRAGRSALLRRERLRPGQISEWRRQVYAAALQALGAEPGSQPVRRIHVSDPLWEQFTEAAALHDPPMRPEQLLRAYMRYHTGLTDHLPSRPGPPDAAGPAAGG